MTQEQTQIHKAIDALIEEVQMKYTVGSVISKEDSCRIEGMATVRRMLESQFQTQEQNTEKKYPIGGYAPGSYMCRCVNCKQDFMGDKRAVQCEPCAEKSVAAQPKEQNTATSAEEILIKHAKAFYTDSPCDGTFILEKNTILPAMEDYHASKLKELSEKGEPTDEEIEKMVFDHPKCMDEDIPSATAVELLKDMRDRLFPVIAALRWKHEAQKGITASAVASAEKEIAALRAENETVKADNILINESLKYCHGRMAEMVGEIERLTKLNEEIASLRAQLETAEKTLSFYAQKKYQTPLYGHIARDVIDTILASKGGKAHE